MPKISVIVPIYKVENYLRECVDSILNQTFSDFELILIDDGSPDNCPIICDEYAKKDARIKVLHKENGGLSSARNAGLKVAKGEFLSFVDSDDYISLNFLSNLYKTMVDVQCDMVVCQYTSNKEELTGEKISPLNVLKPNEYWGQKFSDANSTVVWNKLYKKEIFNNVIFPEGRTHEDEFIIDVLVSRAKTIAVLKDKLYFYRKRSDSIMSKGFSADYVFALINRIKFYNTEVTNRDRLTKTIYLLISIFCNNQYKHNFRSKQEYNHALKITKKALLRIRKENIDLRTIANIRMFVVSKSIYKFLKNSKRTQ